MGAGWGATQPLSKIAVSEGYRTFGLIFWQLVIGALVLFPYLWARAQLHWLNFQQTVFAIVIAMIGTILPNAASYQAVVHLPSGIMSIVIAAVPMIAFPMALALRLEGFSWARLAGLLFGIIGVVLLARPESLPGTANLGWLALALIAPTLYAVEGNVVAKLGTFGLGAVRLLFWSSAIGALLCFPIALGTGTFIAPHSPINWQAPDWALLAMSAIHAVVYSSYVWLISRAGPVFAGQVAYLVTGFGVFWAIIFLKESYSGAVWLALGLMFVGLTLVRPRDSDGLAEPV